MVQKTVVRSPVQFVTCQTHLAALWSRRTAGESPARQPGEGCARLRPSFL